MRGCIVLILRSSPAEREDSMSQLEWGGKFVVNLEKGVVASCMGVVEDCSISADAFSPSRLYAAIYMHSWAWRQTRENVYNTLIHW